MATSKGDVWMVDYGAGNVRSLQNAVQYCGYNVRVVQTAEDILNAPKLIFPGVGAFGSAMDRLHKLGFVEPLKAYIATGRPFFGICVGMQCLFTDSEESPGIVGLGIIPSTVRLFKVDASLSVPHMGWNGVNLHKSSKIIFPSDSDRVYFVHSYMVRPEKQIKDWILGTTNYGDDFVSCVQHGNVIATQFHPEKSGKVGLAILQRFLDLPNSASNLSCEGTEEYLPSTRPPLVLAKRIIACLDVRANDQGDLVVTKGDQYDVRATDGEKDVRNLGKPVELARRYFEEGADEITFLNITSFRDCVLTDQPMLEVLRRASESVFVPLTVGGGIRDVVDPDGTKHSALEVACEYFRSGADKVSLGTDAVNIALEYCRTGIATGKSAIEQIAAMYGSQAVVISVDPKRQFVHSPSDTPHHTFKSTRRKGPNGEEYLWYQCTLKGGREFADLGAYELAQACEALGAGEILLNCIDQDGTNAGFDVEFIRDIKRAVKIPVIASSGAGCVEHFSEMFEFTNADAGLAAGIFHRREVPISAVKEHLKAADVPVRL